MKQAGNVILVLLIGTAAVIGGKMLWDKIKPGQVSGGTSGGAGAPRKGPTMGGNQAEASLGFSNAAAGSYCCKDPLCWPMGNKCKCFDPRSGGFNYKRASVCPAGSAE